MARMFGTDGVRGVAGSELTCELAYRLGQAGAAVLSAGDKKPKLLIGRDTRISGEMLESALVAGILSAGVDAVSAGVLPTPAVAYLTRVGGYDAGVVISASHNAFEFNGIKFFDQSGYKLPDALEDAIERRVRARDVKPATGRDIGRHTRLADGEDRYVAFVKSTLTDCDLSALNVVVDCAGGASYRVAARALSELGAHAVPIHDCPDGLNINAGCGSTHMASLAACVAARPGFVGVAFDGDADRMLAVDENGETVDGDVIMTICARDMMRRGRLAKNTVVVTVMSNLGMWKAAKRLGIALEKTAVGDRYVLEKMRGDGYNFGGEQSGHMIFLDYNTTGDGLVSAIQLLGVVKRTGTPLRELARVMTALPQVLVNARVTGDKRMQYDADPVVAGEIRRIEDKYDGRGRVLIRPSGTEPLVRVMLEGDDIAEMRRDADALADVMRARLN